MNEYKTNIVNKEYEKIKTCISEAIKKEKYEKALAAISVYCSLLYYWNQRYTDLFLENSIQTIAEKTISECMSSYEPKQNTVLFYDWLGFDTRGLALIYLKAIAKCGKEIIYVTSISSKDKQPEIDNIVGTYKIKKIYLSASRYLKRLKELQRVIFDSRPSEAFLYTRPEDAVGIAAFMQMKNTIRYQINLTDHAFWLGVNAFDYCLEFRNYGACISYYEREIPEEKLILMPYYPIINPEAEFKGFPFNADGKKIIFSGGWIYKTIDKEGTYYQIVDRILKENGDTVFLYAGRRDKCSMMEDLLHKYLERAFFIEERDDLYQLMKHITLYLNTYPFPGGLMMQYAAIAGKIPITLWHDNENSGILIDQEKRQIEYQTAEDLITDVNELLRKPEYLRQREKLLRGSVINEVEFADEMANILNEKRTKYRIDLSPIDNTRMKEEYAERFDINDYYWSLARKQNLSLLFDYRKVFLRKTVMRVLKRRKEFV